MGALDEYITTLARLPPAARHGVVQEAMDATKHRRWIPNPGPQTTAYLSQADETLYGGEAGGGKTDLVVGLSLTEHKRALVLRRTNAEAVKLFDRFEEIIGHGNGKNEQKGWKIDGRIIDIGGCQLEQDKQKRKGIPHDLKAFDELVDFSRTQYEFIIAWNRSTDPNQRCRIVATTNPPTRPEGMWVVERWAPWLDPKHPNPAKDGELRWYTTINGRDTEVEGPGPHDDGSGRMVIAKSRTFIRAKLQDNPDLTQNTSYESRLASLPKELREAYMEGRFEAGLKDTPFQAIPTDWIRAAQARWEEKPPKGIPMCGIGVDASGGGEDPMVLAIRHDGWYAPMVRIPGHEIPSDRPGKFAAGVVISYRRDRAAVVVDMGGGYGGPIYEQLKENEIEPIVGHKGSEGSVQRTVEGQLRFKNKRTQVIWRFREALDPSQPGGSPIALPPSPTLLADLAAPTFWAVGDAIQIEAKEDVCERLHRSTDEGDAVVMAWSAGPTYVTDGDEWARAMKASRPLGRMPKVVMGRQNRRSN
jgi:hypothetical protein